MNEHASIHIESCSEQHLDTLVTLFIKVFSAAPWHDRWEPQQAKTYLQEFIANPASSSYLLFHEGVLAAACIGTGNSWYSGREFFIEEMFVHPDLQGKGIGTHLLTHIRQDLAEQGVRRFILLTRRKTPAESFYLKNGFFSMDEMVFMCKEFS